jgi:hypothetical protein
MVIVWHPSQTNAITVNFELDRHAFAASTNMPVFATPQDLFFEYFLSQQCHQTKLKNCLRTSGGIAVSAV